MPHRHCPFAFLPVLAIACLISGSSTAAAELLHQQVDRLIAAKAGGELGSQTDDSEFLRRVYLDLAGRIPSISEVRTFLADDSANKRTAAIDRLLTSDEYATHMAEVFNTMLNERRGEHEEWMKFLQSSFAENKPWDELVRDILHPNIDDEAARGAAFFYVKRLERYGQQADDMPGLVRDIGRIFLGVDVQCAQCHDHLFVDDYKQEYYQGLFAFVGNTFIRKDKTFPAVAEKPLMKELEFTSVFVQIPKSTGPRLPGKAEIALPEFKAGEEYVMPPDRKTKFPGVPKFSTLKVLSEQLPQANNEFFSRNIANRLWWLLIGRGLVEPLDLQHSGNPPSHPELLDLLSREMANNQFDIKWFLRELALTETYQRSGRLPVAGAVPPATSYRVALEKRMSAEQLFRSVLEATGEKTRVMQGHEGAPKAAEIADRFNKAYANPPKEPEIEIAPSVKAALFLSNDTNVLSFFEQHDGNLIDRLSKLDEGVAEELYLSILTRLPTDEERAEVQDYLSQNSDRRETALGHLAWALLASTEFCVNH